MVLCLVCMILVVGETLASTDGCQFEGDMCAIRPECIEEKYQSYAMSDCYEVMDTAPLYQPGLSLSYLTYVDFAVVPDGKQPDDWIYTIYQRPMNKCYFTAPDYLFNGLYEIGKDGIKTEGIQIRRGNEDPYGYLIKQKIIKNCSIYQKVVKSNHSDFAYENWVENNGNFVCYGYSILTGQYFPKPYCMKMGYRYDPLTIALSACCAVVLVLIVARVVICIKLKRTTKETKPYLAKGSMVALHVGTDEKTKSVNDLETDEEACPISVILAVENLAEQDEVTSQQNDTAYISKESDDIQREPDYEAIEEKVVCPKPIENGYLPRHDNSSFEHTEKNYDVPMVEQTETNSYFSKGFGSQVGDPIIEKNPVIEKCPIRNGYTSKKFLSGNTEEIHKQLINYSDKKDFESPSSKVIAKYDEGLPGYISKQNWIRSVE